MSGLVVAFVLLWALFAFLFLRLRLCGEKSHEMARVCSAVRLGPCEEVWKWFPADGPWNGGLQRTRHDHYYMNDEAVSRYGSDPGLVSGLY